MISNFRCTECHVVCMDGLMDGQQFSDDLQDLEFEVVISNGVIAIADTLGGVPIRINTAGWMNIINRLLAEGKKDYLITCPECPPNTLMVIERD